MGKKIIATSIALGLLTLLSPLAAAQGIEDRDDCAQVDWGLDDAAGGTHVSHDLQGNEWVVVVAVNENVQVWISLWMSPVCRTPPP